MLKSQYVFILFYIQVTCLHLISSTKSGPWPELDLKVGQLKNRYFVTWQLISKENIWTWIERWSLTTWQKIALRPSQKKSFVSSCSCIFFCKFCTGWISVEKYLLHGCRKHWPLPPWRTDSTVLTSLYQIWIINILSFYGPLPLAVQLCRNFRWAAGGTWKGWTLDRAALLTTKSGEIFRVSDYHLSKSPTVRPRVPGQQAG